MAKERALDIFQLLERLDRKDYNIWDDLSEEQRKEFSPLIVTRWMAGCDDEFQCLMLNEVMNPTVFEFGDKKPMLMHLLAVCASGGRKRYRWVNHKTGKSASSKLALQLVMDEHRLSRAEALDTIKLYTSDELVALATAHGWQKDEIKDLQKELK